MALSREGQGFFFFRGPAPPVSPTARPWTNGP
jgi:hypothetical protein